MPLLARKAPASDDVYLPFPVARAQVKGATHFRSTWLSSSLRALRERELIDRYFTLLPPQHHQAVRETVAGVWMPVDVALAHYTACDNLGLSRAESTQIGLEVTRQVHGTTLSLAVRLARQAGVTPWSILGQLQRLWDRVWRGGAIAVYRHGPKDAIVEAIGWPCARIPYVRRTMPAVTLGLVEMFCGKAFVHDVPSLATPTSLAMRVQWA